MSYSPNPTENNFPRKGKIAFKDSVVSFDDSNQLVVVTVPVLYPRGFRQISALHTILLTDDVIECTANTFTVTLPTAVGITGRFYDIKNNGAGVITLAADGSETIDGLATQTIGTMGNLTPMSNGTNWILIG